MNLFLFLKFYYFFGFFLIAQVSKTVAYHADEWPDDLTDRGNMKLNNVIKPIITFISDPWEPATGDDD